ncbi:hypothetical protein PAESOLCIP111_02496 [Paenibacillus solanacearum]|uniref:Endonuclease/exonuclease/phosphatase domain-containing protein n=1 Tax=Paenibacillus solanacearum TaxID=2048548 RepID=A0A916K0T7_9BACL|nr:endonuclease/exonuclease/phosphatase family protein [Paenibacillus solanacearum]CAG7623216.1 hypothetical protein PAESOLCIP111_02496 [Paenibacillus solanacearum]
MKRRRMTLVYAAAAAIVLCACASLLWLQGTHWSGAAAGLKIKAMTFNLRVMNNNDEQSWAKRLPLVKELLEKQKPDILGTQEGQLVQVQDLERALRGYGRIGVGREGGQKGEHVAVFYNKERFDALESGNYWLSDTPEQIGSKSWGNTLPRMVTWVKLSEKASKQSFYFVNTHLDHISAEARSKGAQLIAEKAKAFDAKLPVILTGDFNSKLIHPPYRYLIETAGFTDALKSAPVISGEKLGTFNGFQSPEGGGPGNRIDWILYRGNVTPVQAGIDDYRRNGLYASDHYPVVAEMILQAGK